MSSDGFRAAFEEQCAREYAAIPQWQREILERDEENRKLRVRGKIFDTWNVPMRQFKAEPRKEGAWGALLDDLISKLGSGFTIALVGVHGAGKTQLAVELMKHCMDKLIFSRYTTAMGFYMDIKATYRKDAKETEQEVVKGYASSALLVVDEVGKRGQSEWENNLLFEVLDTRYRDQLDTLILGNQSPAEFSAGIGPSLASRLNETGGIKLCNWESFRK